MRCPSRLAGSVVLGALLSLGCGKTAPPPGRTMDATAAATQTPSLVLPTVDAAPSASSPTPGGTDALPGSGERIAAIAMRAWVYLEPDPESSKLGYLRAGSVVERARTSAGHKGCVGSWYRVRPRGYICVGRGATLDLDHAVVKAMPRGAKRGDPMPYRYVISRKPPPHLYFKMPTLEQQEQAEGRRRAESMALFNLRYREAFGQADALPEFLEGGRELPKPYGAESPLHYRVHRGRADDESAFGIVAEFDWTDRKFGLTTELDLIPLDRTRLVKLSAMKGVVIERGGQPAFVIHHGVFTYAPDALGNLQRKARAPYRSGWELTGKDNGSSTTGLVETTAGVWLPAASLRRTKIREDPAGFAREERKWIDVSIRKQILVAYEGKTPVYATLVSTGRGEMGDPATTHATVRGTYMIHAKHVSGTMDGDDETAEPFDLRDVPYIQYFHNGYALHGAYWHDAFGKVRSHGCVNLAPTDAAWLFEWTDPQVPQAWHAAINQNAGTLVYIHG